jgi:photosystem II stability/assembly factor-like uncharacterized protein
MHTAMPDKTVYAVLEAANGNLYAGCETGIYESTNHGVSWKLVHDPGTVQRLLETDGTILAISNERLWRSTDGSTWTRAMSNGLTPFYVTSTDHAILAITRGQEFAGLRLGNEVYRSTDSGLTWSVLFEKLPGALSGIFEIKKAGNAWIAAGNEGIFRSTDNGHRWTQVVAPPEDNRGVFYKLYVIGQQLFALRVQGC